jgi:uncharacterized protein YndB with AHSA1/START domain
MRRVLVTAILALLVIVAVLAGYAATRPDTFRIVRTTTIGAPPEQIFPLINDFDHWLAWSPYERKDPDMERERRGALEGPGSVYAWDGDRQIGKGSMEIVAAEPPSRVAIQLDFERPMVARNEVVFTLEPAPAGTEVTWTMTGRHNWLGKLAGVFMDVDGMVGRDFEAGLASLKAQVEEGPTPTTPTGAAP